VEHFPLARKQSIIADSSLLEGGIIDSLGVLDLINFLEEEFKILVCEEDLRPENFETITTMVAFVQSKNNGQNTP
jgi:acyl carrier protein